MYRSTYNGVATHTFCGTIEFMVSRILTRSHYDHAGDWWKLGGLLCGMLTGASLLTGATESKQLTKPSNVNLICLPTSYTEAEICPKSCRNETMLLFGAGLGDSVTG